ncbi:hypothetical protein P3T39_000923 [Kitasatospora sp. GP82]|nr:hypothetical protein [Kitasatospora sp. GP82]
MDRDQLTELIQNAIDDYRENYADLNDLDTADLADNIAISIEEAPRRADRLPLRAPFACDGRAMDEVGGRPRARWPLPLHPRNPPRPTPGGQRDRRPASSGASAPTATQRTATAHTPGQPQWPNATPASAEAVAPAAKAETT